MSNHSESVHFAHHFKNADHEFSSCKQGMWLFLLQEVLFFSGLFVAYFVFKIKFPEAFHEAHKHLDWRLGFTNTIILITSSLTMAMAVTKTQKGDRKSAFNYLVLTFLCACGFLVVKYIEYKAKFQHGLLPGGIYQGELVHAFSALFGHFDPAHVQPVVQPENLFFSVYLMMTDVHGIHVIGGIIVIAWLIFRTKRGDFSPGYYTPVEMVGLYWHFVDLVWIYLFPLLYLVS
jgi:cytochrome c oxidase subunit 3